MVGPDDSRPQRPAVAGGSPSPLLVVRRRLPGARIAGVLLAASVLVGAAILLAAYLARADRLEALREAVEQLRPGDEEAADGLAVAAFASALVALGAVTVVEVLVARWLVRSGRGRPVLVGVVLAAHVLVAAFAAAVLSPEGEYDRLVLVALALHVGAAAAAAVAVAVATLVARRRG